MDINIKINELITEAAIQEYKIEAKLPSDTVIREVYGASDHESMTGVINGINKLFDTKFAYSPDSTEVTVNGIEQENGVNYYERGGTRIEFSEAPSNVGMTDKLIIKYKRQ